MFPMAALCGHLWRTIERDVLGLDGDGECATIDAIISFSPAVVDGIDDPFWDEPCYQQASHEVYFGEDDTNRRGGAKEGLRRRSSSASITTTQVSNSPQTVWSFNYFLWSRRLKRIVLIWCKASFYHGIASLDDDGEESSSMCSASSVSSFDDDEEEDGYSSSTPISRSCSPFMVEE